MRQPYRTVVLALAFCFVLVAPLRASDVFYSETKGKDSNSGLSMDLPFQSPVKAFAVAQTCDRVWSVGFNFKLLVRWCDSDPYFGTPTPSPAPSPTKDVTIILRKGQSLNTVTMAKRKTNISHTLFCTVNKDTTWTWGTE